jgi:predicted Zn-dependent protease
MKLPSTILGCLVFFAVASFGQNRPKNSDIENIGVRDITAGTFNHVSLDKEVAIGRALGAEYERQVQLNNDPAVNEYVNRLGQNLVMNSDARRFVVGFKIVESADFDTRVVPGGTVYVTTGMIAALDNEAELAFVLSHEIAHVAARHATQQLTKVQLTNFTNTPLIFQGGAGGFSIRQASDQLVPVELLQIERQNVAEADFLGLQYLYKAGYDPNAAVTFLQKVQAREAATTSNTRRLFMSVPPAVDRIVATRAEMDSILPARAQNVLTTPEFDATKASLKK